MEHSLPRAQFRYLTKHFFGRFFDSEVFAGQGVDMHLLAVQMLALLVIPGTLRTFLSIYNYFMLALIPDADVLQAVLADEYFFICSSMFLTGLITVFEWDSLFPDEKDYFNLTPLPVEPRILFLAKLAALSAFIAFSNMAINGVPILLFPWIVLTHSNTLGTGGTDLSAFEAMMFHIGNAAGLLFGSLFVFTSFIAVRAAISLICPVRLVRKATRGTQLALMLALLYALFTAVKTGDPTAGGKSPACSFPPFWFLGLFETLIGQHALIYGKLAKTACIALTASCTLSILGYTMSYRSSMRKGFQSSGVAFHPFSAVGKAGAWILHGTVLKGSMERAFFHFIAQTVFRRREHFLYCGSFVMVGTAIVLFIFYGNGSDFNQHASLPVNVVLSFPLILAFFILVGLRFAFSVPADLNANWIFKVIDKKKLEMSYRGIQLFMFCAANIPLFLVFVPYYLNFLEIRQVAMHVLFASMLSLILIKLLLFRCEKLPFACSYVPGKANIKALWLPYLVGFCVYSFATTALELWMLQDMNAYITFVLLAGAAIISLGKYHASYLKRIHAMQFEEEPESAVTVLAF